MRKKNIVDKPPECWIETQPEKPRKKLYGIWARYNTATKSKIEKECTAQEPNQKRKGTQKQTKKKKKGK